MRRSHWGRSLTRGEARQKLILIRMWYRYQQLREGRHGEKTRREGQRGVSLAARETRLDLSQVDREDDVPTDPVQETPGVREQEEVPSPKSMYPIAA
jgi:hypothetical protein